MGLNKFPVAGGVISDATTRINDNFGVAYRQAGLNLIRQLEDRSVSFSGDGGEWAEAYTSAGGRLSSVDNTTCHFDTNKYTAITSSTEPFIIIEATNISSISDFAINNCTLGKIDSGKWLLRCTAGTDEVKRAQIYRTLFYGTNGTNPRASSTYITGITALKTSVARDVGKRATYATLSISGNSEGTNRTATYTGTFSDTTNNTDFSIWGARSTTSNYEGKIYLPVGNEISSSIVAYGGDASALETDNPADMRLWAFRVSSFTQTASSNVLILHTGTISWSFDNGGSTRAAASNTDFTTDNSIPLFTATTETFESFITHNVPTGTFKSTISTCVGVPKLVDYEDGASVQYKLTNATEDTDWLDSNKIESFTAFTSEPTKCIVKLVPKTTSPTAGYPSVSGFCVYGDKQ